MFLRWIVALASLLLLVPIRAAPAPDARDIVMKIAAQDKLLQQRRKAYDYDLEITREKLDDQNKVTDTSRDSQVVRGDRRPDFGTRTALGQPEDEAKKAAHEEPFELLKVLDHFNYTLEGEEEVEGVPCYKIGFTPKPDMPYANREEKVLNSVSGHLWASKADYSLMRNEGSLLQPVSVAWVFATLREMHFHFETQRLPNGDYGPRQEQYSYLVTIPLWFTMHERDTRKMSNYRPAGG